MIKLLYIDLFCGAGGTTTGVEAARINGRKCAKVVACVNHDANAIASHAANHPSAMHFTEDIRTLDVRPLKELADRQRKRYPGAKLVLWASLECTNFSRAKGGKPAPTVTPKDRIAKLTFLANEYSGGGQISDVNAPCPAVLRIPKQKLVECFFMNPQYRSAGGSIDAPCFTLVARMDKVPPYLVTTTKGDTGIAVFEDDSPMTVQIKEFMASHGITEIKMRMLKVSELKAIMGFPAGYVLKGTISEQKKYIGNAVEVNMSRRLCEALAEVN